MNVNEGGAHNAAPISIFNIGDHKDQMNPGLIREKFSSNLFDPKLQNVQDTIALIVRPMPYYASPLQSLVTKNFYCLEETPGSKNFIFYDSMSTFNNPPVKYEFCPAGDMWFKLSKSPDKAVSDRAAALRQQRGAFCYMLIVNYPRDPQMNGKIVPMSLPVEMTKCFQRMKAPSAEDIQLGAVSTEPFDLINGKNIKVTISGHMPDGRTLMRKWTVQEDQASSVALLPLGPGHQWVPMNTLPQEAVLKFFQEQQTEDLNAVYGYREPSVDTKLRLKQYIQRLVAGIPGLDAVANSYFPELTSAIPGDANGQATIFQPTAQHAVETQPVTVPVPPTQPVTVPVPPTQPVTVPTQPAPVAEQPPVTQPVTTPPIEGAAPIAPPPGIPAEQAMPTGPGSVVIP